MIYNDLPYLSILIFLPLLGALFVAISRHSQAYDDNIRLVALLTSGMTFLYAGILFFKADFSFESFQFVENIPWIPGLSIEYRVGVDGVSILFVLLSTFLTFLALLATLPRIQHHLKEYSIAFLVLETFMLGAFCSMDLFLFFIFFEGVLLPMFFIIGMWGGKKRIYASWKFLLYTLFGSVLMLTAIVYLFSTYGTSDLYSLYNISIPYYVQKWLWIAFFISFAIKIPVFPLHTWLPDAHVEAPTAGSVVLAGVLLKMGGYGFFKISLPVLPDASLYFSTFIFVLSGIAVVYSSMVAMAQKDIKKLIAYSSIAHMGLVTAGLFSFSIYGLEGAVFQMLSHGLISAALFLCIGILYHQMNTREMNHYGGVAKVMPALAFFMMIFILASIALPGTSGFVGEFLIILSVYQVSFWLAVILGSGIILSAIYSLWFYKNVMFGSLNGACNVLKDITLNERIVLIALAISILFLGLFPQSTLKLIEPACRTITVRPKEFADMDVILDDISVK